MRKFKTLVFKDTQKFAHMVYDEWAEEDLPCVLADTATIEGLKATLAPNSEIDVSIVEIINIFYYLNDDIGGLEQILADEIQTNKNLSEHCQELENTIKKLENQLKLNI